MKQITLSIEQMKHLEELGLDTSDASMMWRVINEVHEIKLSVNDWGKDITELNNFKDVCEGVSFYPAYTLQDILEKLPKVIPFGQEDVSSLCITPNYYNDNEWEIMYLIPQYLGGVNHYTKSTISLLDAAYQMFLWCIENGYIKTNKA